MLASDDDVHVARIAGRIVNAFVEYLIRRDFSSNVLNSSRIRSISTNSGFVRMFEVPS